jgi:hypothetical protein
MIILSHLVLVALVGGADEVIEAQAERLHGLAEVRGVLIGELLGSHAILGSGLLHFEAVLVRARQEERVATN